VEATDALAPQPVIARNGKARRIVCGPPLRLFCGRPPLLRAAVQFANAQKHVASPASEPTDCQKIILPTIAIVRALLAKTAFGLSKFALAGFTNAL